jgi:hypothetical protein
MFRSSHPVRLYRPPFLRGSVVKRGKVVHPWWAVAVLLALAACSGALEHREAALASGEILFSDDFSKTPSGWGTWSRGGASVAYASGGLRVLVEQAQFDFWSVAGQRFENVNIEVDATKIGGPDDNDFGVVCRYKNKDNFYMLVASSDGYYGIAKMRDGQYGMIGADQMQYSSAILQGQATNHLRAVCAGEVLRLYANGQLLMETTDSDIRSGDVGVIAGAYNTAGVDILFDNFVVKAP